MLTGCATRSPVEFDRAAPLTPSDERYTLEHVPLYVAEHAEDLDAAVLAMVLDYWSPPGWRDRLQPGWRARRIEQARPREGETLALLMYRHGLWAHQRTGSVDDLIELMHHRVPVLVSLQERFLDERTLFLGLLVFVDREGPLFRLHTGDVTPLELDEETFTRQWRLAQRRFWVVCPPDWPLGRLDGDMHHHRGRFFMALGRYADARADFEQALADDPDHVQHYLELGDAFTMSGRYQDAEPLYRAALRLEPLNARAMNNLAHLLLEDVARDMQEAAALARRATTREPNNPRMLHTLGRVLYRKGVYPEAARVLERARTRALDTLSGADQARVAMILVYTYHDMGQDHLARQTLADALQHDPDLIVPDELRRHLR